MVNIGLNSNGAREDMGTMQADFSLLGVLTDNSERVVGYALKVDKDITISRVPFCDKVDLYKMKFGEVFFEDIKAGSIVYLKPYEMVLILSDIRLNNMITGGNFICTLKVIQGRDGKVSFNVSVLDPTKESVSPSNISIPIQNEDGSLKNGFESWGFLYEGRTPDSILASDMSADGKLKDMVSLQIDANIRSKYSNLFNKISDYISIPSIDSIEKLFLEFQENKEELKKDYVQLYYCLLEWKDYYLKFIRHLIKIEEE